MFSKYDSRSDKELRKTAETDKMFQLKGRSLANNKRARVHAELLAEGRDGYSKYSSPPNNLLAEWDEEQMAHWLPELFALHGTNLKVRCDCPQLGHHGSPSTFAISAPLGLHLSFNLTYWPGCCALSILSGVEASPNLIDNVGGIAVMISERIVHILRYLLGVHQVIFSYSDEEIDYQDALWKSWGGVDIQTPFDSYKTGNAIHTAAIDLANSNDILEARSRREAQDTLDAEYDGEMLEDEF